MELCACVYVFLNMSVCDCAYTLTWRQVCFYDYLPMVCVRVCVCARACACACACVCVCDTVCDCDHVHCSMVVGTPSSPSPPSGSVQTKVGASSTGEVHSSE